MNQEMEFRELPNRTCVLVVEDSGLVAMELDDGLREAGYQVVGPARDLRSVDKLTRQEKIDVALLDVDLGGVKSFPAARELRARGVPFAFLSAYSGKEILPADFRYQPFIEKPVRKEALVSIVSELMERSAEPNRRVANG